MFNTIAEGVEAYKAELRKYNEWANERKASFILVADPLKAWFTSDFHEIRERSQHLLGMEAALGLSKEEMDRIRDECGMTITKA